MTGKRIEFDAVLAKLLESDAEGTYYEPLIGPTQQHIAFDWSGWTIVLLPTGQWMAFERENVAHD